MVEAKDIYLYSAATSAKDIILRYQGQSIAQHIQKTITEIMGLVDSPVYHKNLKRILTELLGIIDTISRKKSIHRTIYENLGLKDTYSRVKSIYRTIIEKLGLLDAISKLLRKGSRGGRGKRRRSGPFSFSIPVIGYTIAPIEMFVSTEGEVTIPVVGNYQVTGSATQHRQECLLLVGSSSDKFQESILVNGSSVFILNKTVTVKGTKRYNIVLEALEED